MTTRTCPDWPVLMEIAPDLQFKHYTVAEAKLPSEVLVAVGDLDLDAAEICCDRDHNVFHGPHTEPSVGEALKGSHWFELVSTWSVLRQSCKPRSPVGLVKQPGINVSAKNDHALALPKASALAPAAPAMVSMAPPAAAPPTGPVTLSAPFTPVATAASR
jgi:hypothetical protein